jgi:hypothetical protein
MNTSKELGFIWWATAGCASRSTSMYMTTAGCNDLYNHLDGWYVWREGAFTHRQGIPEGYENYPIICNTRNPYSRAISAYLDESYEKDNLWYMMEFPEWLEKSYFNYPRYPDETPDFYMNKWEEIGKEPTYIIKMEDMVGSIEKIPMLNNLPNKEEGLKFFKVNGHKYENPRDEYIGEFQHYQKYYTQDLADMFYEKLKPYFDYFDYDKDSWRY